MNVSESLLGKTIFPTLIALITASISAAALFYVYAERNFNIQASIKNEIRAEIDDVRDLVLSNRKNIQDLQIKLIKFQSVSRSEGEFMQNVEIVLKRIEDLNVQLRQIKEAEENKNDG